MIPHQFFSLMVVLGLLGVTACNRNGPGLQSARFWAHMTGLYPSPPAHMHCLCTAPLRQPGSASPSRALSP